MLLCSSQYQVGLTKIFLRDGVLEELKAAVKEFYAEKAARIQAIIRGKKEKKSYAQAKRRLVALQKFRAIQAAMRGKVARRDYKNLKSSILLQKQGRRFVEKKKFERKKNANLVIQSKMRQVSAKKELTARKQAKKEVDAASKLSATTRSMLGRKR